MKRQLAVSGQPPRPRGRWLLWMVLAGSLATLLPATLVLLAQQQLLHRADQAVLQQLAQAVERHIAQAAEAGDTARLQALMDSLASHPLVASVSVVDATGRRIGQASDAVALPSAAVSGQAEPPPWHLVHPLVAPGPSGGPVSTLTLQADGQALQVLERQHMLLLVLALLGQLIGLIVLLQAAAERWWLKPLGQLVQALEQARHTGRWRHLLARLQSAGPIGPLALALQDTLQAQQRALDQAQGSRAELERLEALYKPLHDMVGVHLFVCRLSGQLSSANPALRRLLGMTDDDADVSGLNLLCLLSSPEDWWRLVAQARQMPHPVSADLAVRPAAGRPAELHCRLALSKQRCALGQWQLEGVMLSLGERPLGEPPARQEPRHDTLTGLMNVQGVREQGALLLTQSSAAGWPLTLLLIELDGLQPILAAHGQGAVDEVLVSCAGRLRRLLRRASDLLGRMDALQFLIGLPGVDASDPLAIDLSERVRQQFDEPVLLASGARVRLQARIGVASCPRHATELDALLRCALQGSAQPWQLLGPAQPLRVH